MSLKNTKTENKEAEAKQETPVAASASFTSLADARAEIDRLAAVEKDLNGKLETAQSDLSAKGTDLDKANARVTELEGEAKQAKTDHDEAINAKQGEIDKLTKERDELKANAKTASEGAADLVASMGGDPVATGSGSVEGQAPEGAADDKKAMSPLAALAAKIKLPTSK